MQKDGPQIDSRIEVVTPENIAFEYRVVGPFRRMPAYLIDVLIRIAALLITQWLILLTGVAGGATMLGFGFGVMLLIWFGLEWFYGGIFETFWNGQTPGKWAVGIRVVATDGQPINALQAIMRNVLRAADALPAITLTFSVEPIQLFLYQVGLWVPAFNDRYQRLGDLACGTMVVADESSASYGVIQITEADAIRLAEATPPNFSVNRSLARTLSLYIDRRKNLSQTRRQEIARPLAEPLRAMFNFPPQINPDLLLAAVYYRAFNAPLREGANRRQAPAVVNQPFANQPFANQPFAPVGAAPAVAPPSPPNASPPAYRQNEIENYLDRIS